MRQSFPHTERCIYLNTASAGLSWDGQGAAAAAFYDGAKSRGYSGMAEWRATGLAKAKAHLARMLSVAEDEVGFAGSTTEALNLAMNAVRWRAGDEIVVALDEFPSIGLATEGPRREGIAVQRVPIPSENSREQTLIDALTPATRVMAVSHVHWGTGTRLDLERLSAACTANGTLLFVDGVQALGAVEPRIGSAALYCGSVFKWLLSGFGLAVMVVRKEAREELSPLARGYNNPPPSTDLHYSHVNHPGLYALAATLEFVEQTCGWDAVYKRVDSLAVDLMARLAEKQIQIVTPRGAHAGIVSCVVPNPDACRDRLATGGIFVESREGHLRASPHFYNTHDDVRAYADAVADLARDRG